MGYIVRACLDQAGVFLTLQFDSRPSVIQTNSIKSQACRRIARTISFGMDVNIVILS